MRCLTWRGRGSRTTWSRGLWTSSCTHQTLAGKYRSPKNVQCLIFVLHTPIEMSYRIYISSITCLLESCLSFCVIVCHGLLLIPDAYTRVVYLQRILYCNRDECIVIYLEPKCFTVIDTACMLGIFFSTYRY